MKPFDLEAAKRGDPMQVGAGYGSLGWQDCHFVGVSKNGLPVVQAERADICLVVGLPEKLRMKPVKRTVWINLHLQRDDGSIVPYLYEKGEVASAKMGSSNNCLGSFPIVIEE